LIHSSEKKWHRQMRRQKTEVRKRKSVLCSLSSVLCLLVVTAGCENISKPEITLAEQIDKLNEENSQLQKQIEKVEGENAELKSQVRVLSGLPAQVKGENLYHLQRIKISKYTNLYDKDKDGKKEKLIVYLQAIDQDGDIIKATGDVDVQLWDLSKEQDKALLGQWHIKPEQLKNLWFTALMTHYKLTFDVAGKVDEFKEPLTVKVSFTDYLTGKVFKEQKVIKP